MRTRKLDALINSEASPFEYARTFGRQTVGDRERLCIAFGGAEDACIQELVGVLAGPFQMLYVLHTTRTGAELGRYESPALSGDQVREILRGFGPFLAQDSRHDFWLRSHYDDATIVLDRHNVIFAYGPLESFEAELVRIGARPLGPPSVPDPHAHYYHQAWDESERRILRVLPWVRKPLQESDIQYTEDREAR